MKKPPVFKDYIFYLSFWCIFAVVIWINFQVNTDRFIAMLQTIAIVITSFIFTYHLAQASSKSFKNKKMKIFLIQAVVNIFIMSVVYSFIFTYLQVAPTVDLPPISTITCLFYGKDFIWLFLLLL